MMTFAAIVFFVSLICLVLLFTLKRWEIAHARVIAPGVRSSLDDRAQDIKDLLIQARLEAAKLPPQAAKLSRVILHDFALAIAGAARATERQAHRIADFVSHKRNFERRETESEFLKQVSEYKSEE